MNENITLYNITDTTHVFEKEIDGEIIKTITQPGEGMDVVEYPEPALDLVDHIQRYKSKQKESLLGLVKAYWLDGADILVVKNMDIAKQVASMEFDGDHTMTIIVSEDVDGINLIKGKDLEEAGWVKKESLEEKDNNDIQV